MVIAKISKFHCHILLDQCQIDIELKSTLSFSKNLIYKFASSISGKDIGEVGMNLLS